MSRRTLPQFTTLTIPSGETASNAVDVGSFLRAFTVFAPATLPESVVVQIEPTPSGTDFRTLMSGTDEVTVPAGKAIIVMRAPFLQLRLLAGSAVGADRSFPVCFEVR